jgi:hypothetical protein
MYGKKKLNFDAFFPIFFPLNVDPVDGRKRLDEVGV